MKPFNYGVEVKLNEPFSVVRETLERMGIANHNKKVLYPSCYLLHKKDKYYVIHFKNLLALDGKPVDNYTESDDCREKSIALLLQKWGLVDIIDLSKYDKLDPMFIFVLPHDKRRDYEIVHKYSIGNTKYEK